MNLRTFLMLGAGALGGLALPLSRGTAVMAQAEAEPFKISLAEWSLNKSIRGGKMTNLDFPKVARREFGIDAVEYVNQLFMDKGGMQSTSQS